MHHRHTRSEKDNMFHINGNKYSHLIGSRAQVMNGNAYKTCGCLKKGDLMYNKHHRIVSRLKHKTAKRERRLEKAGYFTVKGKFGAVKKEKTNKRHTNKRHTKKHHKK
jgi:hypothetical protein